MASEVWPRLACLGPSDLSGAQKSGGPLFERRCQNERSSETAVDGGKIDDLRHSIPCGCAHDFFCSRHRSRCPCLRRRTCCIVGGLNPKPDNLETSCERCCLECAASCRRT